MLGTREGWLGGIYSLNSPSSRYLKTDESIPSTGAPDLQRSPIIIRISFSRVLPRGTRPVWYANRPPPRVWPRQLAIGDDSWGQISHWTLQFACATGLEVRYAICRSHVYKLFYVTGPAHHRTANLSHFFYKNWSLIGLNDTYRFLNKI